MQSVYNSQELQARAAASWKDKKSIKYKFTKELAKEVSNHGGYIFGGYPRTMILHDTAADAFYNKSPASEYSDPTVHPELSDRFAVPNDLDIVFESKREVEVFVETLKNTGYKVLIGRCDYTSLSGPTIGSATQPDKVIFETLYVSHDFPEWMGSGYRDLHIKLDVLCANDSTPWYKILSQMGQIDYRCNGLVLTPSDTYQLHPHLNEGNFFNRMSAYQKHKFINEEIEYIVKKEAYVAEQGTQPDIKRTLKMLDYGFEIKGEDSVMVGYNHPEVSDKACLLCLDNFGHRKGHHPAIIRGTCCKAGWLHLDCCESYIKSKSKSVYVNCMVCRQTVDYSENLTLGVGGPSEMSVML